MKALYFLNLWRPATHKDHQPLSENNDTTEMPNTEIFTDNEFEEGEDSYFELELAVPDFDNNQNISSRNKDNSSPDKDSNKFYKEETLHNSAGNGKSNYPQPTLSLSPTDLLSKRKIIPIEPILKPLSPISLLRSSAPRFRVLMFKKSKSVAAHKIEKTGETEWNGVFLDTQKHKMQESKQFTLKLKLKEAPNGSVFTRDNSSRRQILENPLSDEASKRSSKEGMQKFLKIIKYARVSRKQSEKIKLTRSELSISSASSSPVTALRAGSPRKEKHGNMSAGISVVSRRLGKSKSTSAIVGISSPNVNRRDDSLLLQHDGIQSAILHCKESFNSSRASSMDPPRISEEENGAN